MPCFRLIPVDEALASVDAPREEMLESLNFMAMRCFQCKIESLDPTSS